MMTDLTGMQRTTPCTPERIDSDVDDNKEWVSELGFKDPATLEDYEGQLKISEKVDKIGSKNNDYVESR